MEKRGKDQNSLFQPLRLGGITLKNRFALAPLGMYMFDARGRIDAEGENYYVRFARGGFGLVETGAMITDTEIDSNSMLERFSPNWNLKNFLLSCVPMNERIHAYGARMFAQLSLGTGRTGGFKSPSAGSALFDPAVRVGALTAGEIRRKIELLIQAAERCKRAGFDGVDIHAMHWGYLLDQFALSAVNHRRDAYGGSLENRTRAAKEIVQGIKEVCGDDFPVMIRVGLRSYLRDRNGGNAFVPGGLGRASITGAEEAGRTLEEAVEICRLLETYGYDAISADAGLYESFYHACPPIYMPAGNYIPLAAELKKHIRIPVLLSNRMHDPVQSEWAVEEGRIDGVVLGRAALADPDYVRKLERGEPEAIRPCIGCNQCMHQSLTLGACVGCAVNPAVTRELGYGIKKTARPKKVAVVGGGVAGMEAAVVASQSGHEVIALYEATDRLGGSLLAAGAHTFKQEILQLNKWFQRELKKYRVPVFFRTKASADMLEQSDAEVVILAEGASPVLPPVLGIDHPKCLSCLDALTGERPIGCRVVIVGGGLVGCEMAVDYAMTGRQVTLVEALDSVLSAGPAVPLMNAMMLCDMLEYYGVDVRTGQRIAEINDDGAVIEHTGEGQERTKLYADQVIFATGFRPNPSLKQELFGKGFDVYQVGDGLTAGNVLTSVWSAYEIARDL